MKNYICQQRMFCCVPFEIILYTQKSYFNTPLIQVHVMRVEKHEISAFILQRKFSNLHIILSL